MKQLRLSEVLLPLVATRACSPWAPAPKTAPEPLSLRRRIAAARLGGGYYPPRGGRRLFDDVQ